MQERQEMQVWSLCGNIPWSRKWQCCPIYLPEKFHGQRNLAGYSPWGHKQSDKTEQLHFLSFLINLQVSLLESYTILCMYWVCHTYLFSCQPKWTSFSCSYPSVVLFIPTLWVCDSPLHFFLPQSNSKSTPLIPSTTQNTLSALTMFRSFINLHSHFAVPTPLTKSSR